MSVSGSNGIDQSVDYMLGIQVPRAGFAERRQATLVMDHLFPATPDVVDEQHQQVAFPGHVQRRCHGEDLVRNNFV